MHNDLPDATGIALCWFCARALPEATCKSSFALGQVIHSSFFVVSEQSVHTRDLERERRSDTAFICQECIVDLLSKCTFDPQYLSTMKAARDADDVVNERLNFDTGLCSFEEREYHFHCWFSGLVVDCGVRRFFTSRPLYELQAAGLKFHGPTPVRRAALEHFLRRFATEQRSPSLNLAAATALAESAFTVVDADLTAHLVAQFTSVRAYIADVALLALHAELGGAA